MQEDMRGILIHWINAAPEIERTQPSAYRPSAFFFAAKAASAFSS